MTYEEAEKLYEDTPYEKREKGSQLKGLNILGKYVDDGEIIGASEHDQVWLTAFSEEMPDEEVLQLIKYGFMLDEDSWSLFI